MAKSKKLHGYIIGMGNGKFKTMHKIAHPGGPVLSGTKKKTRRKKAPYSKWGKVYTA